MRLIKSCHFHVASNDDLDKHINNYLKGYGISSESVINICLVHREVGYTVSIFYRSDED